MFETADLAGIRAAVNDLETRLRGLMPTTIVAASGDPEFDSVFTVLGAFQGNMEVIPTFSPFKIVISSSTTGASQYSLQKGSIIDGTNGLPVNLSGIIETKKPATAGYIILEASVSSALVVSGWALKTVTNPDDAKEAHLSSSNPPVQDKLRLLIGKITVSGKTATAWQACFSSFRITHAIHNGTLLRVLEAAPTHASAI